MTPKEKAIELVKKYAFVEIAYYTSMHEVKDCALIAVDEILWEIIKYADNSREYVVENSKYWHDVKSEIEKL